MNPELTALLDRTQQIYEDLELRAVAEWKAAAPGRKAIGHMPIYAPREVIHAAGMLPVGIVGGGDRLEIIRGDAYFQSYICHIPRSTIELAVSGRLDALDGMLFPSICDVIRNLSGMWKLLFPGRYVRYLDLPQSFSTAGAGFWRQELETLRADMERIAGRAVSDDDLRLSIAVYNRHRQALAALYAARTRAPWCFPIAEVYPVLRAGNVLPPEEHTQMLARYVELARQEQRPDEDRSRVVLSGMFCEQPPVGLLITLERAGCWIVDDDLLVGMRWLTEPVPDTGDPLAQLAEAYLRCSVESASRYQPDGRRGAGLIDSVRRNRADGVIFCAASFCDPALLDLPMLVAALERERIPHTQFKFSEDSGQFAVIREQAGTFSDSIRLWSEA